MGFKQGIHFRSMMDFWDWLPEDERIITDVLRQIIIENLPKYHKEKLAYNVPFFYGNRRICLIWPGSVPWGGFKIGVLLGFSYGHKLKDPEDYLIHGSNKQVYYKIFKSVDEIDQDKIISLLKEAVEFDLSFK